jgi:putative membrane protein
MFVYARVVLLALVAVACAAALGAREQPREPSREDAKFLREAAAGGIAEVRISELAAERASSVEVVQLAHRLIDDHTRSNNRLLQLAGVKGITVPPELEEPDRARVERLAALPQGALDRAYVEEMVRDHEAAVARFERQVREGQDQDVRNLAADVLPNLREHLQIARNVERGLAAAAGQAR